MALTRPATAPVSSSSCNWTFTTMGETELSTAAGRKKPATASTTVAPTPPAPLSFPSDRTMGTVQSASAPPSTRTGPMSRRGGIRSASLPPPHAPTAMPASTVPITAV